MMPIAEHKLQSTRQLGPIGLDDGAQLLLRARNARHTHDLVKSIVGVDDLTCRIHLEEPQRNRLGEPVQQLLTRPQLLLRGHLLGDVNDLCHHTSMLGIVEQVVVGDLEPDPGPVAAAVAQPHSTTRPRRGQHVHPVVDRQRMIVWVDELDRAMALHLLRTPAQDLCERIVDLDDEAALVLDHRSKPGQRLGRAAHLHSGAA